MIQLVKNKYLHLVIGLIALFLMFYSPSMVSSSHVDVGYFTKRMHQKEQLVADVMEELVAYKRTEVLFSLSDKYIELTKKEGISFYIFENDLQLFWTNRGVAFNPSLDQFPSEKGVVRLKNGWFEYIKTKRDGRSYLALIQLQQIAPITNDYFQERFHESFGVTCPAVIQLEKGDEQVISKTGDYLFTINENHDNHFSEEPNNWWTLSLFLIALLFCCSFLSKLTRASVTLRMYSPLIMVLGLLLLRIILLATNYFGEHANMELFSPIIFAQSSVLPSLGALFLSAVFYLLIVYYLSRAIHAIPKQNKIIVLVFSMVIALVPIFIADVFKGLITNSKISFDVNYLLDLDVYSIIGICSIVIFLITSILFIKVIINHFIDRAFKRAHLIQIIWSLCLVSVIIGHFFFIGELIFNRMGIVCGLSIFF